jgi:hypothetical protein
MQVSISCHGKRDGLYWGKATKALTKTKTATIKATEARTAEATKAPTKVDTTQATSGAGTRDILELVVV